MRIIITETQLKRVLLYETKQVTLDKKAGELTTGWVRSDAVK